MAGSDANLRHSPEPQQAHELEAGLLEKKTELLPLAQPRLLTRVTLITEKLHPAFYIAFWIATSSGVILFNKWVLAAANFRFPLFLTTWHMTFAAAMTQLMARYTTLLDSRHRVPMDFEIYKRAILPIVILFSLSLIGGNLAYLYLSVSFIQMLKASNAVVTLLATWAFKIVPPNFKVLGNVSLIVLGVIIASFGEIQFHALGFLFQVCGIIFEALRLVMVQRLLSSPEFKMSPMVSLYYYAPACAAINGALMAVVEVPRMRLADFSSVGIPLFMVNACVAFLLNVSTVLLIGKTSAVVLTMSGILKDILLVASSILLFGDPVTGQQFVGYSIALGGLVYYKLGSETLQAIAQEATLKVNNVRQNHPVRLRYVLFAAALFLFGLLWVSLRTNAP
ncbi:solute carrier 35 member [Beauveria asiatica]|uniref:Solute carrier 35 member n=1 Tax=Beauveria asiatica TaxID=1069075 RepID=A0AAW0RH68_9HYPO